MAGKYPYPSCSPCCSEFTVLEILFHWYVLWGWTLKLYQVKEARCCTNTFIRNVQIGKSIDSRLGAGEEGDRLGFPLGWWQCFGAKQRWAWLHSIMSGLSDTELLTFKWLIWCHIDFISIRTLRIVIACRAYSDQSESLRGFWIAGDAVC